MNFLKAKFAAEVPYYIYMACFVIVVEKFMKYGVNSSDYIGEGGGDGGILGGF